MKINLKTGITNLAGDVLKVEDKDLTVGEALSNIYLAARDGGKMKMFVLAQRCYKDEVIQLDEADVVTLKRLIEGTEMYNNLVTGQILLLLEKPVENS